MDHSARAYLARIPMDKLISFLESDLFNDGYSMNDSILQDLLEVLISRNAAVGGRLLPYIHNIQEIQEKRNQSVRQIEI